MERGIMGPAAGYGAGIEHLRRIRYDAFFDGFFDWNDTWGGCGFADNTQKR
jgi:hypothetical protein